MIFNNNNNNNNNSNSAGGWADGVAISTNSLGKVSISESMYK